MNGQAPAGPSRSGPAGIPDLPLDVGVPPGRTDRPDTDRPHTDRPELEQPRRAWVEQVMGMPVSIHVRGPAARHDDGPVPPAVRALITRLHRVDAVFSPYRDDSQVCRLRRGELTLAECEPQVREVARLCEQARDRTAGWFDASDLPGPDGRRGFNPTGLVKGWAIEQVTRQLSAALDGHDVLVNAGGDLAVRCRRDDTPDWQLAIEDPADRSRILARVPLRTGAMATSGTAARGAHILDPATGVPVAGLGSVTVIGPDLTWADVHATAAFAMGEACLEHLAGLADHLSFVVMPDGSTRTVTGRRGPDPGP